MTWYPGAVGTWWLSGAPGYEVSVERTHLGFAVRVESRHGGSYGYDVATLHLNHHQFSLEDAQQRAEALVATLPRLEQEPLVTPRPWSAGPTVIRANNQKVVIPGGPVRCGYHHAWPLEAEDDTTCQCGRLTFGFARTAVERSA